MITATVVGNLGSDADLKYSQGGTAFLRLNIASNTRVRDNGEWVDMVEWVRATVLGQRAESLAQHLTKGTRVFVQGKLEARPWTDNNGAVRSGLELTVSEIDFMGQREQGGQQSAGRPQQAQPAQQRAQGNGNRSGGQQRPQQRQQGRSGAMSEWQAAHGPDDQDVPF